MGRFVVAAMEGDFCDRLAEVARACGLRPAGAVQLFGGWPTDPPLPERKDELAAALSGEWTVLVDDWGVTADLFDRPKRGAALARRFDTRVVAAFADNTTGECGYRLYSPEGVRGVFLTHEGVAEDVGEPFPGEGPVDPEANDLEGLLGTLGLLGIDVEDGFEMSTRCAVVRLAPKRGRPSDRDDR